MTTDPNTKPPEPANRPDPFFKLLTRFEADKLGLQARETGQQFVTRSDLVLHVPPGLSLEGTMFDFFSSINVVEFGRSNRHLPRFAN